MQVWHVVSQVKSFMYSPPSFMSWRPLALYDIVNASWMSQSSSRMFCGVIACVWPSVKAFTWETTCQTCMGQYTANNGALSAAVIQDAFTMSYNAKGRHDMKLGGEYMK